ncbi:MAG TPA: hypothetical protein VFH95_11090 [Candidatus Kapabacteria bacterium]|nr:hypothetical protein [Candidatus Kapabacteria bacterium]
MKESSARSPSIVLGIVFLFACGLAYEPLYHIVRGSLAYSIIPQDDFYYYYLTAKHFAATGFSSFDGIVPTNGYHPLWMLVLTGLSLLAHGNDPTTFILIEAIQILSAVVTAALTLRLFRRLYGDGTWIPVIALLVSLLLTVLILLSMETVVAIPLYLLFALTVLYAMKDHSGTREAFWCGAAGTLLFLARIDTLLAIGIVFLLFLFHRAGSRKSLAFLAGLSPIVAYFILNKALFGNWLPVSAEVKELGSGLTFSFLPIEVVRTPRGALYFLLTIAGFVLTLTHIRRGDARVRAGFLLFAFPVLFALVLAIRLSWPAYVWYFYPFPISAGAALLEVRELFGRSGQAFVDRFSTIGLIFILCVAAFVLYKDIPGLTTHLNLVESETRAQPNIYIHALGIKPFTDSHPGRYAMGDRAGLTAFITGQPILQIEGLAADQSLVDSIAARADLLVALKKYGVHYYIVSYPLREFHERNWTWDLFEPHKQEVLPWMPLMHGHFYAPEVFRFPMPLGAPLTAKDSSTWVTRILDISEARPIGAETN